MREQKLLQEVENWQNCWKEERDKYEQLRCQLEEKEREFVIREEKLGLEHNKERHQLKQEIFTLSTKVSVCTLLQMGTWKSVLHYQGVHISGCLLCGSTVHIDW